MPYDNFVRLFIFVRSSNFIQFSNETKIKQRRKLGITYVSSNEFEVQGRDFARQLVNSFTSMMDRFCKCRINRNWLIMFLRRNREIRGEKIDFFTPGITMRRKRKWKRRYILYSPHLKCSTSYSFDWKSRRVKFHQLLIEHALQLQRCTFNSENHRNVSCFSFTKTVLM